MIRKVFYISIALLGTVAGRAAHAGVDQLERLWVSSSGHAATARLELGGFTRAHYFRLTHPDREVIDLLGTRAGAGLRLPATHGWMRAVRMGLQPNGALRLVFITGSAAHMRLVWLQPTRAGRELLIELNGFGPAAPRRAVASPRAIRTRLGPPDDGRDIIVTVDPGHGGIDSGTIGPHGVMEKNITLAIGRLLAERIDQQRGMRATMTRDSDVYLTLRDRMRIARRDHADLFVSIHVNDCDDPDIEGAQVYILSLHGASNEAARILAARENASDDLAGVRLRNKSHTLASVLLNLSQTTTIAHSVVAAHDVLLALDRSVPVNKMAVQQAAFVVLKSPTIPSMLVETDFMSDPTEAAKLTEPWYQKRIADAIFRGILAYFRNHPPAGTLFAEERAARLRMMVARTAH
jgi:N-acetylmuramoyl-L-alanine amidase